MNHISPAPSENKDIRRTLIQMFEATIAADQPARRLPLAPHLSGRLIIIGAGKASAAMAQAADKH